MAEIFFPEKMDRTEGLDDKEVLKIHDDYIRYIVERIDFAFNGYTNKKKFFQAVEDVVEDGPLAKELENEKSAREQAIDRMNEKIEGAGGLYTTVDPETGIVYMHDKKEEPGTLPPFRESKNVIQISTAGIFVSNDGGVTWPTGFTLEDGETILNKIYAIGIDANYIKANTLSADKIEATEGVYPETDSWNSMKSAYITAYILGTTDFETAYAHGADINGDGNIDFMDLALCLDSQLHRETWNRDGGTFAAQIKCDNGFNAMSVSADGNTAFSAGVHGVYTTTAYVKNMIQVFDKDGEATLAKVKLDKDGIVFQDGASYPANPLTWQSFTPSSGTANPFQYAKYLNVVDLYGGLNNLPSGSTTVNLGTFPCKPRNTWAVIPTYSTAAPYLQNGSIWISETGAITLYKSSASTGCYFGGTFVCKN